MQTTRRAESLAIDFVKTAKANGAGTVWAALPVATITALRGSVKGIDVKQIRTVKDAVAEYRDELGHRVMLRASDLLVVQI